MSRTTTNIHIDCDSLWIYASEYGTNVEAQNDAIFADALPRFLDLFEKHGVRATFFLVGRDLSLPRCREFCLSAISRGHRMANHTFSHLQDLHTLSTSALDSEIRRCHEELISISVVAPVGLRLPGYYFDQRILPILSSLGYRYDSSILPGWGVYLMALFYRLFNVAGNKKRFGRAWYPFARTREYRLLHSAGHELWEYPLATFPLLRLPIHSTFVLTWGLTYFRLAYALRQALRLNTVLLFHAIDLLDGEAAGLLKDKIPALQLNLQSRHSVIEAMVKLTLPQIQLSEAMADL